METIMSEHDNDKIWQSLYDQHCKRKPGGITRKEYMAKFNVNYDNARAILEKGIGDGVLTIVKQGHSLIYYPV